MKKNLSVILPSLLLLALLLCACGIMPAPAAPAAETPPPKPTDDPAATLTAVLTEAELAELDSKYPALTSLDLRGSTCYAAIERYVAAHPGVAVTYTVDIGGTAVLPETKTLELSSALFDAETLCENSAFLPAVTDVSLGVTTLSPEEIGRIAAAFPNAEVDYAVELNGECFGRDTTTLRLGASELTAQDISAYLGYFPSLTSLDLTDDDRSCPYTLDELYSLHEQLPGLHLICSFDLFGHTVSSEDEKVEFDGEEIGPEGVETLRKALPLLSCTYCKLADCGIDNETLARLKAEFPERNIVWRVWIFHRSLMTDTKLVRTVHIDDYSCDVLKYCTEVRYVDFGHNDLISDFSFLSYMPHLEAAIIAMTGVTDISPLADCPELEFLEVFDTDVADLSPLAKCTKLEYLNIANMPNVTDISPLYGLTNLKQLRIITDNVPQEQKEEIARRLPDCELLMRGWDETENGWRHDEDGNQTERYILLRQQMEYDLWRED